MLFVEKYKQLRFNFGASEELIGNSGEVIIPPAKKLEDLIRLSELCVDLLRQNEEFYAEVNINLSIFYFKTGCF